MKTAMKIAAAAALLATVACEKEHAPLRAPHIPHADTTAAPTVTLDTAWAVHHRSPYREKERKGYAYTG